MSDISLPNSIKFDRMEYLAFSFQEVSNAIYESFYFVDTNITEQPRVVLISSNNEHIELCFGLTATIGIKNFELFYNEHDLVECNEHSKNGIRCIRCPENHKPIWQEKQSFHNLKILECDNGHTKIVLLTPQIIKEWKEKGIFKN